MEKINSSNQIDKEIKEGKKNNTIISTTTKKNLSYFTSLSVR